MRPARCRGCRGQGKVLKPVVEGQPVDLRKMNGALKHPIELVRVDCPDCGGRGFLS